MLTISRQTFWLFQTHLHDLSSNPAASNFKTCRRIFNQVQHIVFGSVEGPRYGKVQKNPIPVTLLAGLILGGVAVPSLPREAGRIALAQARKPRPPEETVSEPQEIQVKPRIKAPSHPKLSVRRRKQDQPARQAVYNSQTAQSPIEPLHPTGPRAKTLSRRPSHENQQIVPPRGSTSSLPELVPSHGSVSIPERPGSRGFARSRPSRSRIIRSLTPSNISEKQKSHLLRIDYFRNETQFLSALEEISNRLVTVPKQARLSALRAELALLDKDLSVARVDVPLLCPATLRTDQSIRNTHHRVVRIDPAQACVLNSAEKVPYLLMVEVLRDDFDFDPASSGNKQLVAQLAADKPADRRRLFDLSRAGQMHVPEDRQQSDSVFEPAQGDIGNPSLLIFQENDPDETPNPSIVPSTPNSLVGALSSTPRLTNGARTPGSTSSTSTPQSSKSAVGDVARHHSSRSQSSRLVKVQTIESTDFSALATHMRMAAQMLAQLEATSSKRPRAEVEAIKGKIIANMQMLEEQSFDLDMPSLSPAPTFDDLVPDTEGMDPDLLPISPKDIVNAVRGNGQTTAAAAAAARMENDQRIGGVARKGDRDDPSAAMFGEEWTIKRERIKRSSPYGWMKNWDLLSVIVKTGADLRQEAFACQLIQLCGKIWQDAGVPVWVKNMRILVTGESAGLIETIANGVSVHSIKRSLTLASIASGQNPRGQIASLKDHFERSFGTEDSNGYRTAVDAFVRSLAAYSILSYVLQLKDRHNGNILIDSQGHIIHIDFGFMLSNSPGSVGFEAAPFKLPAEYVAVLGGADSPAFGNFRILCKEAFLALRKSAESIVLLVSMMGEGSKMPCFAAGGVQAAVHSLRARFQLQLSPHDAGALVENELIPKSLGSYYTRLYDTFQYRTQGIY